MRTKTIQLSGAKGRLLKYLEYKGVCKAAFYKVTRLSNGFLDKNNNISSNNVEIIISCYPDINLEWLITGQGEMINTISDIDSKFTPQSTTLSLDSLHSLFEKRKSEHRIILKKKCGNHQTKL